MVDKLWYLIPISCFLLICKGGWILIAYIWVSWGIKYHQENSYTEEGKIRSVLHTRYYSNIISREEYITGLMDTGADVSNILTEQEKIKYANR